MKTVGAAYLRTHFSRLIGDARRGETIVVTRRGRPIVRLRGLVRSSRDGGAEAKDGAAEGKQPARKVGVFDARENLPRLLDQAERGEPVVITSHGDTVARIEPISDDEERRQRRDAVAALLRWMDENRGRFDDLSIRELIDEGRRY
jgi:prevent-host-death family protein